MNDCDYFFQSQLCALCALSPHYSNYVLVLLLLRLFVSNSIIRIILFPTNYLHYVNYCDSYNSYNAYNQHNCIKFMYTPPHTLKWCMASESGFNSWNAFANIRDSYSSKNIAKSRWSAHLRLGRHPQETGV
jgi:hypothetical protein